MPETATENEIAELCLREIDALHQFFQEWFRGELPDTDRAYARFADALDPHFGLVSPSGRLAERQALLDGLRAAHGRWQGSSTGRIWIENARVRQVDDGRIIATYEEWQEADSVDGAPSTGPRARLSTVVFRLDPQAPGGVRWLHVHETWMDPS